MRKTGRRLAASTLAATMVLSVAACGKKAETPVGTTTATTAEEIIVAETEAPTSENQKADIVVVDAGGAGMTATIQTMRDGAINVVVLEKTPVTGDSTTRSAGGLNVVATKYQEANDIGDSVDSLVGDTMKGGRDINDKELVTVMAEDSTETVDWVNKIGGDLSVVGMFGGVSVKRIRRPSNTSTVGSMLIKTLNAKVAELNIPVFLETTAQEILVDVDDRVSGITAVDENSKEVTIDCTTVVLATDGFEANVDMIVEYKSDLAGFGTTNHVGATGDGITVAVEDGAALVDMERIQTHPTVNPDTQTMYTRGARGNDTILVNKEGLRFVNELETRDVVSAAILKQADKQCYTIFDQAVRDSLSVIEPYVKVGIATETDAPEALSEAIDVDGDTLAKTLKTYADYQVSGTDADFDRESMEVPLDQPEYYAAPCAPAVHHTMGGVKVNTSTEVLKRDGTAIPGLFAAGEVTGGVHGASHLGGNAVADIVVFGRVAGTAAGKYVMDDGGNAEPEITVAINDATVTPEVEGGYKGGVCEGAGTDSNGDIKVEITAEGGNIVAIVLKEHGGTEGICEAAKKGVTAEIIKKQTAGVDAVSDATNTSKGIVDVVADALSTTK